MALTVETGTGSSSADSYAAVAESDTYHAAMGNTAWAAATVTTAVKEEKLRQATQYLDRRYGLRFVGVRLSKTQALLWPRLDYDDRDGDLVTVATVAPEVKTACMELALRALDEDLFPDLDEPGDVSNEAVSVGPISVSTGYLAGKSQIKRFREVEFILSTVVRRPGEIIRS